MSASRGPAAQPRGRYLATLTLAALGVVYGDIGTSPLYALRECFRDDHGVPATGDNVLGVLSLIFWSLVLIISLKYLVFVMRADNRGEGGVLALLALAVAPGERRSGRWRGLGYIGLFGAALLYGDGMITPAISVLSAAEGLELVAPELHPLVAPGTLAILAALFLFQRRGTARVGAVFGPLMLLWFVCLAALGVRGILLQPGVLRALDPLHALRFLSHGGATAVGVLGAVFLVVTGGEALYADMGHFGRRPIRLAWFALVLPALLLNYFGQGAALLRDGGSVGNPFYRLAPAWGLVPLVALATAASVVASQAIISGAFSLTRQAIQLGYCPRLSLRHTSAREIGQIYVPLVNWGLFLASCALVIGFSSSGNLAAAYGMAVATTMMITTVLLAVVAWRRWGWRLGAVVVCGLLLVLDSMFFYANLLKVGSGGWFPLGVGAALLIVFSTWQDGRRVLEDRLRQSSVPMDLFLRDAATSTLPRVEGTAVFLGGNPGGVPHALLHNIRHNRVLHQQTIFLHVETAEAPFVPETGRAQVLSLGQGFHRVLLRYGFMEQPDVPRALQDACSEALSIDASVTTFFLGREKLISSHGSGMARWRERLFALLAANAGSAASYFRLPPNRVIELGAQVEL